MTNGLANPLSSRPRARRAAALSGPDRLLLLVAAMVLGTTVVVAIVLFVTGTKRLLGSDGNQAAIGDPPATIAAAETLPSPTPPSSPFPAEARPGIAAPAASTPVETVVASDDASVGRSLDLADAEMATDPEALLPRYRILSYYGHPHDPNMGILGEYGIEELHARLREQAAAYEAADPSRPVKLAFQLIATVAQSHPGPDGTYLLSTDAKTIQAYAEYAAEHDMLLILDVQIGRRGVAGEIEVVRRWLELPHVHLALDPEFAVAEGEQPGVHIGQIDAADVRYAQETLAALAADLDLPPKILIVHQFHYTMITNKDQIEPMPGVQFVLDVAGWGPPEMKRETYNVMAAKRPIEFHGFKLWYRQDKPLMTPEDVIALEPVPDLVIYQ